MILAKTRSRAIPPEAVGIGNFHSFFRYNFRPQGGNDVRSGAAVDNIRMDDPVNFGDSRSNSSRGIRGS